MIVWLVAAYVQVCNIGRLVAVLLMRLISVYASSHNCATQVNENSTYHAPKNEVLLLCTGGRTNVVSAKTKNSQDTSVTTTYHYIIVPFKRVSVHKGQQYAQQHDYQYLTISSSFYSSRGKTHISYLYKSAAPPISESLLKMTAGFVTKSLVR